jgi:peptide/nickel transport system substrate-binding protein
MRSKFLFIVSLLIFASMVLGACQPAATPAPQDTAETATGSDSTAGGDTSSTQPSNAEPTKVPATDAPAVKVEVKNPDTFMVITGAGEPESLDPAWMYDTASSTVALNLYEGLVAFKRESISEFVPALATDWSMNDAGDVWTFNIREGVKFHQGGTLEPHDIAYTFARALLQGRIDGYHTITYEVFFGPNLSMASVKDFAAAFIGKESFDDLSSDELVQVCEAVKSKVVADDAAGTVTYNTNGAIPYLFPLMAQQFLGGILDMEWMAENGDWDGDCNTWQNFADPSAEDTILYNQANGTGPYLLDHYTSGEEIVLTAFQDYWRTEPMWENGPSGVASIPRVVIKNITEWGTRLAMFEAGDADYIYAPPQYRPQLDPYIKYRCGIDESSCVEENADGYIKAFRKLPSPAITPAQFNWNINTEGGNPFMGSGELDGNGMTSNFFSDVHIRRAFSYCFDYDAMIVDALASEGVQAQGPIPVGMMGYLDEPPLFSYDLAKCEEEFKLADLDGDGIPAGEDDDDVWSKGFYMQIAYNTGNDTRRLSSEILKAGIEEVNPKFSIAVVGMPWPVMLNSRRAGKLPVYVGGWVEDYHDPHNWVHPFLYSQGAYGRIVNMDAENAAYFDDLILRGAAETDPATRTAIYEEIQTQAQERAVDIWMYQVLDGLHFQSWMNGFYYNPAYGNPEYGWIYAQSKSAE